MPQAAITNGSLTEMQAISSMPLPLSSLRLLDVGGQVPRRAGRRERAGHREQRHPLAAEKFAAGGRLAGRRRWRWSAERRAGGRPLGWSWEFSFASGETADRLGGRAASSLARRAAAAHCRSRWLSSRVSCPASCCWRCREWPTRGSSARSSRCAFMTKMARSASASATSAPASRFRGLLRQLDIDPGQAPDCAVHHGGPVEPGRGFVLHSTDWGGQDTLQVNGDNGEIFAMTGTIDVLRAIAEGRGPVAMDRGAWLCRLGRGPARRGNDPPRLVRRARGQARSCSIRRRTSAGRAAFKAEGIDPRLLASETGAA